MNRFGTIAAIICLAVTTLIAPSDADAQRSVPVTDYQGRDPNADWRAEAKKRIEEHRKGQLLVTVLDDRGNPVPGTEVSVAMTRHAFGWGSAVSAELLTARTEDGRKYRELVGRSYSRVVFENDLKWPQWLDQSRRKTTFEAIRWLDAADIEIRGHCLVWPSWKWLPRGLERLADDPTALRRRVNEHVTEEVAALRGRLVDFDVINETYTNHELMDILGREVMVEWFRLARRADPDLQLYINDYAILGRSGNDTAHQDDYFQTIRYLLDAGTPLDGIGLQSHFKNDPTPPARLIEILDRFATFGLPLQITEHDISLSDATLHADYTRDFLTAVYSHPAVTGILTWGFWEGRHWRPEAAYYRRDWSIKPAGQAWNDLVLNQWWTKATGTTDASGQFETRGFLGDYTITAGGGPTRKTAQATLVSGGTRVVVE